MRSRIGGVLPWRSRGGEPGSPPTFVVGDVHGCADVLLGLLRDAGLADSRGRWRGRDARLWLIGDLVDRGPDGFGAIELARGLQREGDVHCLLGNHELLIVGARRFPHVRLGVLGETFFELWQLNGGVLRDLELLSDEHVDWITSLPALALEAETLLLHADSGMYLRYGSTVDAVNATIGAVAREDDTDALAALLSDATDRHAFADPALTETVLATFGGRRIVHGHTPISLVLDTPPAEVTGPFVYDHGRCVNVDHGLFLGGTGFVTELSRLPEPPV